MRKNLQHLDELQELDLKADGLRGERESVCSAVAALEGKVEEARAKLAEKTATVACLEEEKQKMEENIALESENTSRSEARLKEIKTQKEYQAVSKEISTAKKQKTELEEQVLQKLALIEELKGAMAVEEENLLALEGNIGSQKEELTAKIAEFDVLLAALVGERELIVKELPASLLKRYTTLREQRRGIAVVQARDGSCLGCNMGLPPQLYNTLFKGEELITCPHCQRVLVIRHNEP